MLAIAQFNHAIYAGCAASGPPSPNPEGFYFMAGNNLAWAGASLLAGWGVFALLGASRGIRRYAMAALLAALLLAMFPHVREAAAAQACGDARGRWSELRCIKGAAAR